MPNTRIIKATYGTDDTKVDFTQLLQSKVSKFPFVIINNNLIGDPCPGIKKHADITYEINEVHKSVVIQEGEVFNSITDSIDNTRPSVLICYYTNNKIDQKILHDSIKSIERIQDSTTSYNTVMIVSTWEKIENINAFQIVSAMQNQGSINILMQIIDCLSFAYNSGVNFEYVMMAEHDVLYPHNYIDSLNLIDKSAEIISNQNCIGLCEKGYQNYQGSTQKPLHQIVFSYNYAIKHFTQLLLSSAMHRHFVLEPYLSLDQWFVRDNDFPSVHINHDKNFTSHYNCYSKDEIYETNDYWGHYQKYYPLNMTSSIKWS